MLFVDQVTADDDQTIRLSAAYDRFVTADTRFWHASGLDLRVDAGGLKIETQSLAAMLTGDIAIETAILSGSSATAGNGTELKLPANRTEAMKQPEGEAVRMVLRFRQACPDCGSADPQQRIRRRAAVEHFCRNRCVIGSMRGPLRRKALRSDAARVDSATNSVSAFRWNAAEIARPAPNAILAAATADPRTEARSASHNATRPPTPRALRKIITVHYSDSS